MIRLALGLVLTAVLGPFNIRSLFRAHGAVNAAPTFPTMSVPLARVIPLRPSNVTPAAGSEAPAAGVTELPQAAVPEALEGGVAAPDLEPDVTPPTVKAGEVRRVQTTPCHDCGCCTAYATRIASAQREITRLRDEALAHEADNINRLSMS